jgi:hypothetical protein
MLLFVMSLAGPLLRKSFGAAAESTLEPRVERLSSTTSTFFTWASGCSFFRLFTSLRQRGVAEQIERALVPGVGSFHCVGLNLLRFPDWYRTVTMTISGRAP